MLDIGTKSSTERWTWGFRGARWLGKHARSTIIAFQAVERLEFGGQVEDRIDQVVLSFLCFHACRH
jgi:hypothetical protein